MPYLGDYVGQLLAEIAMARMQADLETVRLAELYEAHPLLRTMPVPRMRLPQVDLELPVAIQESEEPRKGESSRGGFDPKKLGDSFMNLLDKGLDQQGVKLTSTQRKRVQEAVTSRLTPTVPTAVGVDVRHLADAATEQAVQTVGAVLASSKRREVQMSPEFGEELRRQVRLAFMQQRSPPPRLFVLVTGAEIREAGEAQNLTRLKLSITEQAVEWTTVETEGGSTDKLVPE